MALASGGMEKSMSTSDACHDSTLLSLKALGRRAESSVTPKKGCHAMLRRGTAMPLITQYTERRTTLTAANEEGLPSFIDGMLTSVDHLRDFAVLGNLHDLACALREHCCLFVTLLPFDNGNASRAQL